MSNPIDPWRFMAVIAECAQESGVEVERAFRFMAAVTLRIQAQSQASAPAITTTTTAPSKLRTVQ